MDESLNLLVVITNNTTPQVVQTKIRFGSYDIIVLIPSPIISLDDRYIKIQHQNSHYSVYINRNSYNTNLIPLCGRDVCGILVDDYNIAVLSVGTNLGDTFFCNIQEFYPNKTLIGVHRSFPNMVFDICTKKRYSLTQENSSYYEKVLTKPKPLVLV